ncbi:helix-turn-helix domain-containing protein [Chryseobacterium sp.]|uniref:helix-turn-helix domain-containing protein n=1 Tax=Chryseobacterium sp. TaxID=1871047 RepID=UPI0026239FCB|nr:helix-turn-helix domain-containing protein [Chryseobacterium sp.]
MKRSRLTKKQHFIVPDYKRIFKDIILFNYPEKEEECKNMLNKEELSTLDIIYLNQKIFGNENKNTQKLNQSLRSYNKKDIIEILEYQKKNKLNNSELASHFKMSRNTISKWKTLHFMI